jgi:hypothetical protein
MRRYGMAFVLAAVAALLISALLRAPRRAPAPPPASPAPAAAVMVAVEVLASEVHTTPDRIAAGSLVQLAVRNRTGAAIRLALTGYEDRVTIAALEPDSTWRTRFLADRPGEQFAWLVDGQPRGRLDIAGSHLVEGHR